jgi:threonine dehydrogenase-like Zn-dependent dehydrogenase
VIVKVTTCAICGSDLHLMDGQMPTMKSGDVLGHEFMGEVEVGSSTHKLKKGVHVVVPFNISSVTRPPDYLGMPTSLVATGAGRLNMSGFRWPTWGP